MWEVASSTSETDTKRHGLDQDQNRRFRVVGKCRMAHQGRSPPPDPIPTVGFVRDSEAGILHFPRTQSPR